MEAILSLIFIGIMLAAPAILSAAGKGLKAGAKTAAGSGTFKDNLDSEFKGMGEFQVRTRFAPISDDDDAPEAYLIEAKGLFPTDRTINMAFVTSVFDTDAGELCPVISMLEGFQEVDTVVYNHTVEVGATSPGYGFVKWVRVGVVIPPILQGPRSGDRRLKIAVRIVDLNQAPEIDLGSVRGPRSCLLWTDTLEINVSLVNKGYRESVEERIEAVGLTAKMGLAVGMADGHLDDAEGETLRDWIVKYVSAFTDDMQEKLKASFNDALKTGYDQALEGRLELDRVARRMNEIADKASKYEALELCYDVMAADEILDTNETETIRNIATWLELDSSEVEQIRDRKIVSFGAGSSQEATVEEMLGIDPNLSDAEVRTFLRSEFQKWNNRLNTLPEGEQRDSAQRMLDLISEARNKYK